ncbi:copper homeostasis protein CutC [Mucilaginibacter sp. BT774]|uniref:copper homeostasis protein CutC n=1 Tax=Mucilaginibacter sp. BT774 TaxID=3062276 RepID=UPI0026744201|nr:copper homeostasis protein CutC [Mucilaginibacter sp. BT774]MDO3626356.1 copper homeostasis protein CutC [Mucilaginibacter sp. BT774]
MINLEVCANTLTSALSAQEGGAIRVELCDNLGEGGTTPSYGQIKLARQLLHIKLYVLVRPREGDFLYTDTEFEIMKTDVQNCIDIGCDGVVIGILNPDGSIDTKRCAELVKMATDKGLGVTFHRAFDMCNDMDKALEEIIAMGCERILTSGGRSTAIEGAHIIAHLIEKAAGRIIIMPGSGVSESTVADLVHYTKATEIHSSARGPVKSQMQYHNDHIILSREHLDESSILMTNANKVREIIKLANGI